jgi:hypothetical protein
MAVTAEEKKTIEDALRAEITAGLRTQIQKEMKDQALETDPLILAKYTPQSCCTWYRIEYTPMGKDPTVDQQKEMSKELFKAMASLRNTLFAYNASIYIYALVSTLVLGIIGLALPAGDTTKLVIGIITAVSGFITAVLNYFYDEIKKIDDNVRKSLVKLHERYIHNLGAVPTES